MFVFPFFCYNRKRCPKKKNPKMQEIKGNFHVKYYNGDNALGLTTDFQQGRRAEDLKKKDQRES